MFVAGQRPSIRSALVIFLIVLRLERKLESGLDVVLREAEITTGGRSTPVRLSKMFDPTAPRPSRRNGLSFVSISPDVLDENLVMFVGHIPATNRKEWAAIYYHADSIYSALVLQVTSQICKKCRMSTWYSVESGVGQYFTGNKK